MIGAVVALLCCVAPQAAAQTLQASAGREFRFQMPSAGEAMAEITVSAPGASWDRPGAEGTVATISIDGQYNQDLILTRGEEAQTFHVFLGPLMVGTHALRVARNSRWSAAGASLNVID